MTPCDYKGYTHTLIERRTDVNAVPHAGLGYHFLRVQVKPNGNWVSSNGNEAQNASTKSTSAERQDDGVRAHLQNALALYQKIGVKACKRRNQAGTWILRPESISVTCNSLFLGLPLRL